MKENELYIIGGLGDCLLYTPLIQSMFCTFKTKTDIYVSSLTHYQLLLNNPYCELHLISELNFRREIESRNVLFYGSILPTISCSESASQIISSFRNVPLMDSGLSIFLTEDECDFGKKIVEEYSYTIAFNPSSQCSKNQEWPYENWVELIKLFPNISFLQLGVESETLIEGAIDFRGSLGLREQLSILAASNNFLGVDSFWSHASAALKVKGVVLFGDSSPLIWGHDTNINVYKELNCSPCIDWIGGDVCPYNKKCMTDISVDDVFLILMDLIV
jgi:hypothetical protein